MGEPEVLGISLSLQCWYHRKLFPFVLLWGHAEYREKNTAINVSACSVLTYCWIHWIHMLTTRTTVLIIHLFLSSDFSFISFRHLYTYIVFKYIHKSSFLLPLPRLLPPFSFYISLWKDVMGERRYGQARK